jgi:hypothetical protein
MVVPSVWCSVAAAAPLQRGLWGGGVSWWSRLTASPGDQNRLRRFVSSVASRPARKRAGADVVNVATVSARVSSATSPSPVLADPMHSVYNSAHADTDRCGAADDTVCSDVEFAAAHNAHTGGCHRPDPLDSA